MNKCHNIPETLLYHDTKYVVIINSSVYFTNKNFGQTQNRKSFTNQQYIIHLNFKEIFILFYNIGKCYFFLMPNFKEKYSKK